ncbi:MAG: tetratricopeptide repeat protein [Candidatus Omnitrophica bacterium]|nr:tetratricopeptide repeat protein [Candidatus Omnitrophota bacterium]
MKNIITATVLTLFFVFKGAGGIFLYAQDSGEVYRQGIEYAAQGKFKEAGEWFTGILKKNRDDSTSASSLEVIRDLESGKINPAYARSFFLALDFLQKGKIEEGLAEIEKTIALDPGYPRPYNVAGMIYASMGDKEKSIESLRKAVAADPRYSQAYFNLGLVYQSSAQPLEALESYRKAVSLDPDFRDALLNLGAVYASLGKYDEAVKSYRKAIPLDRNNPALYYNLALVYLMSDNFMKFRENLLKAEDLYRRNNDAEGQEKVAVYMKKIEAIEKKLKHSG